MGTVQKLADISCRIEHLERSAEWITKETVHSDNSISQTATLITVLADEIWDRVCSLVKEIEAIRNKDYLKDLH